MSTAAVATRPQEGLTSSEAKSRLAEHGPNSVHQAGTHRLRSLLDRLMGPVPWMLEAAIVLELVVGKVSGALLVFNAVLSAAQEGRAADALALLRRQLAVQSRVRRDGVWQLLDAAVLVPGDVVHVRVGDVAGDDLRMDDGGVGVDESILTGETKQAERSSGDQIFAGSTVKRGEATATATATVSGTSFGLFASRKSRRCVIVFSNAVSNAVPFRL